MFYLDRKFVCERLRLCKSASYRMFSANNIHLIPSDRIISVLNRSRRGREEELSYIPSDIITADELEKKIGIKARRIITWTRRKKNVPPHFRINKQTTRFRLASITKWLAKNGR